MRLLYGLERLPTTMPQDDPRLPAVTVGATALRLHSVPAPEAAWPASLDFETCWTAYGAWLQAQCGAYRLAPRRMIARYLDWVVAHVRAHAAELEARLAPYDGLYRLTDLCWSAWRPLPLVWEPAGGTAGRLELGFWNGTALVPVREDRFPERFWAGEILPVSPFRRVIG